MSETVRQKIILPLARGSSAMVREKKTAQSWSWAPLGFLALPEVLVGQGSLEMDLEGHGFLSRSESVRSCPGSYRICGVFKPHVGPPNCYKTRWFGEDERHRE